MTDLALSFSVDWILSRIPQPPYKEAHTIDAKVVSLVIVVL